MLGEKREGDRDGNTEVNGVTETCTARREVTELTETREMGTIEERLHGKDGVEEVEDAHTHGGSGG